MSNWSDRIEQSLRTATARMLCPKCLREVDAFVDGPSVIAGVRLLACPICKGSVPVPYVQHYAKYPPRVFSIVGHSGHGKTVYLGSLLYQLDRVAMDWPDFVCAPLDESGMQIVQEKKASIADGRLPESTKKIFPDPVILQMDAFPTIGRCHLLVYDTSGEAFESIDGLRQYGSYVSRSPSVVLLFSLQSPQAATKLSNFLTLYEQAVRELDGNPAQQSLLVVLTKADELSGEVQLPPGAEKFLSSRGGEDVDLAVLTNLSHELETWLSTLPGFVMPTRRMRKMFARVEFTTVSALGAAPDGSRLSQSAIPCGVLSPVTWIGRIARESGMNENRRLTKRRSLQGLSGLALGMGEGALIGGFLGIILNLIELFLLGPGRAALNHVTWSLPVPFPIHMILGLGQLQDGIGRGVILWGMLGLVEAISEGTRVEVSGLRVGARGEAFRWILNGGLLGGVLWGVAALLHGHDWTRVGLSAVDGVDLGVHTGVWLGALLGAAVAGLQASVPGIAGVSQTGMIVGAAAAALVGARYGFSWYTGLIWAVFLPLFIWLWTMRYRRDSASSPHGSAPSRSLSPTEAPKQPTGPSRSSRPGRLRPVGEAKEMTEEPDV